MDCQNLIQTIGNTPVVRLTAGVEIVRQVPEITHFVAGMGTTGTLMGVGKRLKEYNTDIRIIGVEPEPGHKIQGMKNLSEAIVPGIYDPSVANRVLTVSTEDAYQAVRDLALREGILAGMSSGAALLGARQIIREFDTGTVVVLFPDRGEKYLSTTLFENQNNTVTDESRII